MVQTRQASTGSDSQNESSSAPEASTPTKRQLRSGSKDVAVTTPTSRTKRKNSDASEKAPASTTISRKRAESDVSIKSTKTKSPSRAIDRTSKELTETVVSQGDQDTGTEINVSQETPECKKTDSNKKVTTPKTNESTTSSSNKSTKESDELTKEVDILTEEEILRRRAKRKLKRRKSKGTLSSPSPSRNLSDKEASEETPQTRARREETSESNKTKTLDAKVTVKDKVEPTIKATVHRVRYMNFHPKPILCLRATPPRDGFQDYVAISRDNGSVEIRAANEKLRVVSTVAGNRNKPVTVMAWTCSCSNDKASKQSPNLIGGCRDGSLFVIDADSGTTLGMIHSGGGGVFALVSLCQRNCCEGDCCQLVAAGCEDGSIRVFQVQPDSASLELVTTIPAVGDAVLSLAWIRKRTTPHESNIFAGVADGTIRRYDFSATSSSSAKMLGTCKQSVRMTVESLGRTKPTRVWALECLTDGTLISVDSLGHVQFWDGNSGTLEQTFDQNENKADVLALAVTANENMVFATGVDSRVVCIERSPSGTGQGASVSKWVITNAQRPHTHDVNSLAIYRRAIHDQPVKDTLVSHEQSTKEMLVSGGIDTKLGIYDINNFQRSRPRVVYPWSTGSIAVASKKRMFIMLREDVVDVYKLGDVGSADRLPVTVPENNTLIGSIEISGSANLVCAAIGDDAEFLALADVSTLYLFRLTIVDGVLKPVRLQVELPVGFMVQAMCFHQSHQLMIASGNDKVHSVDLFKGCQVDALTINEEKGTPTVRGARATAIHLSKCGGYVATVRCSVGASYVDIFKMDAQSRLQFWWTLPLEIGPSAVSFIDGDRVRLAVCCSDFSLYVFDVADRALDKWSKAAGYPVASSLPIELKQRFEDYPVRLFHDPSDPQKLFMVSDKFRARSLAMHEIIASFIVAR
jgi:U3 small nucleolar RNA-associated protein 4